MEMICPICEKSCRAFSRVMTRPVGQVSECFPILGSSRIASEDVRNLTGRARSGQEVLKYHTGRVGSGRLTRTRPHPRYFDPAHEEP